MREGLTRAGQALLRLYPDGISLFWRAPLVLALVVVPEFVQHVVEIRLGMFDGREAFRALADDPSRMAFGYAKSAGLILAMLAALRFWGTQQADRPWYDLRGIAWRRLAIGFVCFMLIPSIPGFFNDQIGKPIAQAVGIGLSLILLPTMFLMIAGLMGDRDTSARAMWRESWPWALFTLLLLVLAFLPTQWPHQMNHRWALGAEPALVLALMVFVSLLVGLMAGLIGTAFYLGYAGFAERPA